MWGFKKLFAGWVVVKQFLQKLMGGRVEKGTIFAREYWNFSILQDSHSNQKNFELTILNFVHIGHIWYPRSVMACLLHTKNATCDCSSSLLSCNFLKTVTFLWPTKHRNGPNMFFVLLAVLLCSFLEEMESLLPLICSCYVLRLTDDKDKQGVDGGE